MQQQGAIALRRASLHVGSDESHDESSSQGPLNGIKVVHWLQLCAGAS